MNGKPIQLGDVTCIAIWKNIKGTYTDSKGLFIGKIKVAEFFYNAVRPKGDPNKYKVTTALPLNNVGVGAYATEDECEAVCLNIANEFCKLLNSQI